MKKWMAIFILCIVFVTASACGAEKPAESTQAAAESTAAESAQENTAAESAQAGTAEMEAIAGEYVFYGTQIDGQYVTIEDLMGTSTKLEADGTGYLKWGENNEGPISKWTVSGEDIVIEAGVSKMSGHVKNGVMIIYIGDEEMSFAECYVRDDADTSSMPQITAEEWAKQVMESEMDESKASEETTVNAEEAETSAKDADTEDKSAADANDYISAEGGGKITIDDITDFYDTYENINYNAFYQRYRFYVENGKHMFFHETREVKDDYGPATEENTTKKGSFELTDDEWNEFFNLLKNGTVSAREESTSSGESGPWYYLYWKNDKSKYQQYEFASPEEEAAFEEFCVSLAGQER